MPLPNQIPAANVPIDMAEQGGGIVLNPIWYLFFYNLAINALSATGVLLPPALNITMADLDADAADGLQSTRAALNAALSLPDQDAPPSAASVAAALMFAQDAQMQDPLPCAQPAQAITVGASPFTFTAPANGAVVVRGGTVSALAIVRNSTSVAAGVVAGALPVSRLDQVVVTYTGAPTMTFLPT